MSSKEYSAPSVRQLAAVVDGMAGTVSPQRMKQLRMVVGMWDRAIDRSLPDHLPHETTAELFTGRPLRRFWALSSAGLLRARPKDLGKPLPLATERIVRDCLLILARRIVPEDQILELPSVQNPELKATVASPGLMALYRGLVDMASAGPLERDGTALTFEDRTRLLAMVAVVLDTGARSGELAALRLSDVAAGEAAVGIRRRQQKAPPNRAAEISALTELSERTVTAMLAGELHRASEATRQRVLSAAASLPPLPEVEWYALREGSRVALRRWLEVREDVVEALPIEGGRTALWVTLAASKAGPPGVTIKWDGLVQAYERGVTALNVVMAGEHGWEPMPLRMEQLRRSVDVKPLNGPPFEGSQ